MPPIHHIGVEYNDKNDRALLIVTPPFYTTFLSNDPCNSTVVDPRSGFLLYQIVTPHNIGKRKTTKYDAQGNIVAVYKRCWGRDKVTFRGQTRRLSEWMSKKAFSTSRRLVAPNGIVYDWKRKGWHKRWKMVDHDSKRSVAKAQPLQRHLMSSSRKMNIEVYPEATGILDAIVFSLLICERDRRRASGAAVADAS